MNPFFRCILWKTVTAGGSVLFNNEQVKCVVLDDTEAQKGSGF